MKRCPKPHLILTPMLIAAIVLFPFGRLSVSAQLRARTAPARDAERSSTVPNNARTLSPGDVIVFRMEDELRSDKSKAGDRFRASVIEPVETAGGKILIPVGTPIEGFVTGVSKAKWGRRSGVISISFSTLENARRKKVPVRARLTSSNADERKMLNDDGNFRGKNPTKTDIVFIGGGAGLGAGIGAITGGILVGTGIGAAAGLTIALLAKGRNAEVRAGQRFGMELLEPLSVADFTLSSEPKPPRDPQQTPTVSPGALDPADATVERIRDGSVRLRINAQTPTPSWRVYTNHEFVGSTAKVRLRGTPPGGNASNGSYISPAQEICFNDSYGALRRVEVLGKNGTSRILLDVPASPGTVFARASTRPRSVSQSYSTSVPTNYSPYYPGSYPTGYNPETGRVEPSTPTSRPQGSDRELSALAQDVLKQVETLRVQYAINVGYVLGTDGVYRTGGARQPTTDQRQLMDSLGSLINDLRELRSNATNAYLRRNSALKVQEGLRSTQPLWSRARLDGTLNSNWNAAAANINILLDRTLR
ncbi:MAG TPA: hypothetical protein PLD20_02185 [Blastocatellia bacterium]|nr:hypothetical protein [Blastocatellia bacterium]HMX28617.1 hypothetical protein [Blastocatellia bacterium]HMY72087.1 hypothetical protein [Blastocatellia bacterium]HMZ16746.1 hypothetical protein [Blastocatellia bacterium]HNG28248.1 hypothetical protein [Blastocatellia bacterium]